ncbi:MAG: hypothetical protein ACPGJS_08300 [Flammeovirgaceae bacterium]
MEFFVREATREQLSIVFQRDYNRVWVVAIVSFFIAGLIFWFFLLPYNHNTWMYQGPLLKRDGSEVLFRVPNYDKQENFYVPLDEAFVSFKEDRKRYELILYGRTSERLQIFKAHQRRIAVYKTEAEAKKHRQEILDFLASEQTSFQDISASAEDERTPVEQALTYTPFLAATLCSLYFLLVPVVRVNLVLNRGKQRLFLRRSSLLVPRIQVADLANFESADLEVEEREEFRVYKLMLKLKAGKSMMVLRYTPPYRDDKLIASLSQHRRMINWWFDEEMIDQLGDALLTHEDDE